MKKLLLFLTMICCLSGCSRIEEANIENTKDDYSPYSNYFVEMILEDPDIKVEGIESQIKIERILRDETLDGEFEFIVLIKDASEWADDVWYIRYDREKILEKRHLKKVDGTVISCEQVELSHGQFIEFYSSSHQGNGTTMLWNINTKKVEYEFERLTVDNHLEGYVGSKIVKKYNLTNLYEDGGGDYSFLYEGGKLSSEYKDINGDGKDDVIFCGVRKLVESNYEEPIALFYIKDVHLYDTDKDKFVYNKKLSQEKELK